MLQMVDLQAISNMRYAVIVQIGTFTYEARHTTPALTSSARVNLIVKNSRNLAHRAFCGTQGIWVAFWGVGGWGEGDRGACV